MLSHAALDKECHQFYFLIPCVQACSLSGKQDTENQAHQVTAVQCLFFLCFHSDTEIHYERRIKDSGGEFVIFHELSSRKQHKS